MTTHDNSGRGQTRNMTILVATRIALLAVRRETLNSGRDLLLWSPPRSPHFWSPNTTNSMPNLHVFSGPSHKMLFLCLIINIRSTVMPFRQMWPPLPIYEAIFNYGYILGHIGGQICRLGLWLIFFPISFNFFFIEIVNFDNSAKNGPKLQKLVRTKAQKTISSDFALVLRK